MITIETIAFTLFVCVLALALGYIVSLIAEAVNSGTVDRRHSAIVKATAKRATARRCAQRKALARLTAHNKRAQAY